MLTELEQRANAEARHAHRELVEVELRNMALDYLVAAGQAAEAYQAQLAAEAKLEKAVEALEFVDGKISWEINPSNYDHDDVCNMNSDWCEIGNHVEATLAELKGDRQMSDVPTCSFCGREVRDDDRIEELEAKNARLREALEILEIAATGAGVPHDVERKNLHEGIKIARAALQETDK